MNFLLSISRNYLRYILYTAPIIFMLALSEAVFYEGVVKNFVGVDIKFILVVMALLLLMARPLKSPDHIFILRLNRLLVFPSTVALYVFLLLVESRHYLGYIFGYLHIHPQTLIFCLIFSGMLLWVEMDTSWTMRWKRSAGFVIIGLALVSNLFNSSWLLSRKLAFAFSPSMESYDQRMHAVWGDFYTYSQFVNQVTESDALIIHPPQENPWQMVGNQLVLRYFVYPRRLVQSTRESISSLARTADYVIISNGTPNIYPTEHLEGWPQENFAYERIWLQDPDEVLVKVGSISDNLRNDFPEELLTQVVKIVDIEIVEQEYPILPQGLDSGMNISVTLESTDQYAAKLVAVGKSAQGETFRVVGNSNWQKPEKEGQPGKLHLTLDDEKVSRQMGNFGVEANYVALVITNKKPLPYLYKIAVAKVAQNLPILAESTSTNFTSVGNYYYMHEQFDKAEEAYSKALLLDTENVESRMGLYFIHERSGRRDLASEQLRLAELYLPDEDKQNLARLLLQERNI